MPRVEPFDIAAWANQQIGEFVQRTTNRRLLPGTGCYSTPFRGTLFGRSESKIVAQRLTRHRVDALWLGSNPHMKRSLDMILNGASDGRGDFHDFERQRQSGMFGSARWSAGKPSADFSPLQHPEKRWSVYHDILRRVFGSTSSCAMANCIPWGSDTVDDLVARFGEADPMLLTRAMTFAGELTHQMIRTLNPRVLLIPFSLGRNRRLDSVRPLSVSMSASSDWRRLTVETDDGAIHFYTGIYRSDGFAAPAIHLRHPSSLRLSNTSERRLIDRMHAIIVKQVLAA